jgi:hypothetical protein
MKNEKNEKKQIQEIPTYAAMAGLGVDPAILGLSRRVLGGNMCRDAEKGRVSE